MRRPICLFLTLLCCLQLLGAVWADARSELRKAYAAMEITIRKKDLPGTMAFLTADFENVSDTGRKQGRKEFEADLKEFYASVQRVELVTLELKSVRQEGSKAVADVVFRLKARVKDVDGSLGPPNGIHALEMTSTERETWVRSKAGWKIRTSQSLSGAKVLVDGKPPRREG